MRRGQGTWAPQELSCHSSTLDASSKEILEPLFLPEGPSWKGGCPKEGAKFPHSITKPQLTRTWLPPLPESCPRQHSLLPFVHTISKFTLPQPLGNRGFSYFTDSLNGSYLSCIRWEPPEEKGGYSPHQIRDSLKIRRVSPIRMEAP